MKKIITPIILLLISNFTFAGESTQNFVKCSGKNSELLIAPMRSYDTKLQIGKTVLNANDVVMSEGPNSKPWFPQDHSDLSFSDEDSFEYNVSFSVIRNESGMVTIAPKIEKVDRGNEKEIFSEELYCGTTTMLVGDEE